MTTRLQWWAEANRAIGSVLLVVYVPTRDQVDIQSRYADIAGGFPMLILYRRDYNLFVPSLAVNFMT